MSSTLIRASRIDDDTAAQIVWGFACGAPIADVAAQTVVSEKTVRQIVLCLRERLDHPAFNPWSPPGETFILYDWGNTQKVSENAIYGVLAQCYFNKRCVSNYLQGRRSERICTRCPIPTATEDEDLSLLAVQFLDHIRAFYQHLGIGGERRQNQAEMLRQRWRHTLVTLRAKQVSLLENDVPVFDDEGPNSCRMLYDKLITNLNSQPLAR